MAVTSACDPHDDAVMLNIQAGQRLRYEVMAEAGIQFTLRDHTGRSLLSSSMQQRVREWPLSSDFVPAPGEDVSHPLGMQFGQPGELHWRVDVLSSNGVLIKQVKHCTYTNSADAEDHFDDVRIFIT